MPGTARNASRSQTLGFSAPAVAALAADLHAGIRGEVRFDPGSRTLYSTDASNYREVPVGVVIPRDLEDVVQTMAICRGHGTPVLPRGGGTSLAGQCCNVAVVIDFSKYLHRVLEIDPDQRLARVQPGVILDSLREAAKPFNLTFGPDPATHDRCTLGGMIGNNSCGVHSIMAGMTDDNIEALEILTYDGLRLRVGQTSDDDLARIIREGGRRGEIYAGLKALRDRYADLILQRFPDIPRRVSGYNLPHLLPEKGFHVARALVGSEGTCVTILEATTRLVYSPPARSMVVLGYPDVYVACDHVPEILTHSPVGLEGFDWRMIDDMRKQHLLPAEVALLPPGRGWLLVEFGGATRRESDDQARGLMDALRRQARPPAMELLDDPRREAMIWAVREAALGATAQVPGHVPAWPGWEDSAVAPEKLGDYLRDLRRLLDHFGYEAAFYGHFGQGCVHLRIDFDLTTGEGIKRFRSFMNEAANLVIGYGGSLSGEHGDGQARAELLPKMFGPELIRAFQEFKAIWDPGWKMNPGKIVRPNRIDQDLRLGTGYAPPELKTHFTFPDDHGSFARATLRCVGVGKCRRLNGGTMCPSFMALREEEHSTRGRARLLFEMLEGDPLQGGWRDEHVKEALDLCLACKGCKGECPVRVDMATYKAEFLSHYYSHRLRPAHAYAFGLIFLWARLAALAPGLVNAVTQAPLIAPVAKAMAGMAPERQIPAFASETFKQQFRRRAPRNPGKPPVILWPDTFNNHFSPEITIAAVDVLEAAGYQVVVPERFLCCGRPLYDYGMLDLAKRQLRTILDALRPQIRSGVPVVGLEPSCLAVFRDELVDLFPSDEDARRLSKQSFLLSEFLEHEIPGYAPPPLHRQAIVHGHCHHKAIMGMSAEEAVLAKMGLDYQVLDSGCCGMAGAFGFERGKHYDVSINAGERVLLPAVRAAADDTLIVTDGFSCREQISQTTERHALHLAQVLQMAMREGPAGPTGVPEFGYLTKPAHSELPTGMLAGAGAALAAGALAWELRNRRTR